MRLKPGYGVLEIGCGTGNVLHMLRETCTYGKVIGVDLFMEGLQFAKSRSGASLVQADVGALPFADSFDLVGAFDVLEHLPDDVGALQRIGAVLKPGGTLLLTVPAHRALWSYFDEASNHCRRYEMRELRTKLASNGFEVEYISEFMVSIFPLVWVSRKLATLLNRWTASGARKDSYELANRELRIIPIVNRLFAATIAQELKFIGRRRVLRHGTSIIAIARKNTGM